MSDLGLLSYLGLKCTRTSSTFPSAKPPTPGIIDLGSLTNRNPTHTPMEEMLTLSRDSTAEEVDATQYQRIVGSLHYLVHTRLDLAFLSAMSSDSCSNR